MRNTRRSGFILLPIILLFVITNFLAIGLFFRSTILEQERTDLVEQAVQIIEIDKICVESYGSLNADEETLCLVKNLPNCSLEKLSNKELKIVVPKLRSLIDSCIEAQLRYENQRE